jgi:hypothetical protein
MTEQVLQALRQQTNHRNLVIVRESALVDDLHITPDVLRAAIARLEEDGLLEVLSPLPFLVVKWSGKGRQVSDSSGRAYSFNSSLSQTQQMKESYRPSDAESESLLQEILQTLGESDPTTFRGALRNYPPGVIRTALARIRKMRNIQKNPTAVFRFLLPRIANEPAFKK